MGCVGAEGFFRARHPFRACAARDTRASEGHKAKARDTSEAVHTLFNTSLPAGLGDFIAMAAFLHRSCSSPSMEKSRQERAYGLRATALYRH